MPEISSTPRDDFTALLLRLCAGLAEQTVAHTSDGAAPRCPACDICHTRSAETVVAYAMAWKITGDRRWLDHARRLADWAIARQQADGAWAESEEDPWTGISIFILVALAAALNLLESDLPADEADRWHQALDRGISWARRIRSTSHIGQIVNAFARRVRWPGASPRRQFWNTNYLATLPLFFRLAGSALNRDLANEEQRFLRTVLRRINADDLVTGEINEPAPGWAKLFRRNDTIDPGYNLDMTLGVLALYARRVDDSALLKQVARCADAHLCLLQADGSVDNAMGSRGYKMAWYGSQTAHGMQMLAGALAPLDARYLRAGLLNSHAIHRCMGEDNLLRRGPFEANGTPPCVYPSFARAANLALALMPEPTTTSTTDTPLACEQESGHWLLPSLGAQVLRHRSLTLVLAGPNRDSSWLPYRFITPATGASPSRLHHDQFGPVQAAGHAIYQRVEAAHMPARGHEPALGAHVQTEDGRLSSLHDVRVRLTTRDDRHVSACGRLRGRRTFQTGPRYALDYRLGDNRLDKSVRVSGVAGRAMSIVEPLIVTPDTTLDWATDHTLRLTRDGQQLTLSIEIDDATGQISLAEPAQHYAPPLTSRALTIRLSGANTFVVRLAFVFSKD